jgi:CRISPR system Cascade subunit CasE
MTHLTQITIPAQLAAEGVILAPGKRLQLRDSYGWHQLAWTCFKGLVPRNPNKGRFAKGTRPEDQPKPPADLLMRLDQQRDSFRLLIVSPIEPTRPDWCPPHPESWKTKPIPEMYFSRRQYAFQLCANPTKKVTNLGTDGSPTKNGRRVPLRTREELVAWINRKGEQGSFSVGDDTLRTFSRGREYFEKNGMRGLHSAVEFQGVLTVTDPQRFHETFTRGLGSAKAFGFGLLVIVPTA